MRLEKNPSLFGLFKMAEKFSLTGYSCELYLLIYKLGEKLASDFNLLRFLEFDK